MTFDMQTHIPGCSLITDEPAIAHAFISLVQKTLSPAEWLQIMSTINPEFTTVAKAVMVACLGAGA